MAEHQKRQVVMYHHTHWDREWWSTFQYFRFRLVHIVDRLLEVLDTDPSFTCFVLDGQTIVLKDYLEVRPENREKLIRYIKEGRITVGPWHILPDEFLVSGEAHIRNLWLGHRTAQMYGIRNTSVGYLPDQFGHISQMPQVLAGFGIDSAVVWRGFGAPPLGYDEGEGDVGNPAYYALPRARNSEQFPARTQSEFWWEAPDGTRVLGIYLPLEYYRSHFAEFPNDPDRTYDQVVGRSRRTVNYLSKYATTRFILEPMGGDHLPIDPRLPKLLAWVNRELAAEGIEYIQSDLEDFVRKVKGENPDLQVVWKGEGRAFGRRAHLLPGVFSTRLYLKQMNRDCQVALERYAESYQALNWMLGGRYEQQYLWLAWERLIQNHPHDSICGCSHDQVHREMLSRFDEAKQMADLLSWHAQEDLALRVDTSFVPEGAQTAVVFNPLNWPRTDLVRLLMSPHFDINPLTWVLTDPDGHEVPFQVQQVNGFPLKFERYEGLGAGPGPFTKESADTATEVSFVAQEVPALGYRAYSLQPRERQLSHLHRHYTIDGNVSRDKGALETTGLRVGPGMLENQFFKVTVDARNGSLTLLDKQTGQVFCGLNTFRDGGDEGDTYNYSRPVGDQIFTTENLAPRVEWAEVGSIRATLRLTWQWALPESLTPDRLNRARTLVPLELHSEVTLYPGVKRVDIRTHFMNASQDHRLQVLLPFGARVEKSAAEGQFHVVERPTRLPDGERGSAEPAVSEHPQQHFVSVSNGSRGLTVANRGLPEFAVYDDEQGTIALTVLRSVGWLSRSDFTSRVEGAGPQTYTPEAQVLGPVVAEYSLIPHAGNWDEAQTYRQAHDFNAPLTATATVPQAAPIRPEQPVLKRELPPEGSLLAVDGNLLLSALKKAEERGALIVRFVNESAAEGRATLRPVRRPRRAYLTNLKEEPLSPAELTIAADGSVEVVGAPWQIVTIALEF